VSDTPPEVMTVEQAAELLQLDRNTVYAAIKRKEIPAQRIGKSIRLSRAALLDWLRVSAGSALGK